MFLITYLRVVRSCLPPTIFTIIFIIQRIGFGIFMILLGLKKYDGITGEILFDASWNDIGRRFMAEIVDGDFVFSPAVWKYE